MSGLTMNDVSELGTVDRDTGQLVLHFERRLGSAPDEVWRILTASAQREHWIPCGSLAELREGTAVQPPFWPVEVEPSSTGCATFTGVTRVWQAPSVFEWTSDSDRVRWEVSSGGRQDTQLAFTSWIGSEDMEVAANAGAGYHTCFEHLVRLVDTGSVGPSARLDRPEELEARYRSAFAAALADTD